MQCYARENKGQSPSLLLNWPKNSFLINFTIHIYGVVAAHSEEEV